MGRTTGSTGLGHQCQSSSITINVNKKNGINSWTGESQLNLILPNKLSCTYPVTFQVTFDNETDKNNNHFSWAHVRINYPVILRNSTSCFGDNRGDYMTTEDKISL